MNYPLTIIGGQSQTPLSPSAFSSNDHRSTTNHHTLSEYPAKPNAVVKHAVQAVVATRDRE